MAYTAKRSETLGDYCRENARRFRDRLAFRDEGTAIGFGAFNQRVNQWCHALLRYGASKGDRIALLAKDSVESYAILFACAKLGLVLAPLNWRLSGQEIAAIINDCHPALWLAADEFLPRVATTNVWRAPTPLGDFLEIVHGEGDHEPKEHSVDAETPLVMVYTSGTTGKPKGVVLPHRTFTRLVQRMRDAGDSWMGINESDVLLLSLPQFHIGGMWWAIHGFMAGSCGQLMDVFMGWKALELIRLHRITKVAMVPAMIQFVLAEPNLQETDFSRVTGFLYGGSPIAPGLLRRAMETFRCPFFQIYGLTETGNMAVCLRPESHADETLWQAAGQALPGVELKVVDADGVTLPQGVIGEVWIRSPSAMLEYWNSPGATAATLQDGWIITGDAGYLDARGYLFVCDRIKDMIIYAGENIYPAEIEAVLASHAQIAECAVIGVPDERFGEQVKAFVVLRDPARKPKTRELMTHCREQLADFKVPKSFEFVESIPRNPSGKILKHQLRQPYWESHSRQVN